MRDTEQLIGELKSDPGIELTLRDAPMREYCSFRAGGRADCFVVPGDEACFVRVLGLIKGAGLPYCVMGEGTNLLVRDGGFRGVIVKPGAGLRSVRVLGNSVVALCGATLSALAEAAAGASLGGLEFARGIPGSVGGAVYMNAGAYGGEISAVIESARVLSDDGSVLSLRADEMGFSYRNSVFRSSGGVVLEASFALARADEADIRARMAELSQRRAEKQPLNLPSAGSFFKRPAGGFAGKLIEDAGLAGLSCGRAMVSTRHAGFIVNAGGATATEITDLMEIVRSAVFDRFGVMLEPEVRIIGDDI